MKAPEYKTYRVRGATPGPWTKWWEHPWQWWKMRKLRKDIKAEEDALTKLPGGLELRDKLNDRIEKAVLDGEDLGH